MEMKRKIWLLGIFSFFVSFNSFAQKAVVAPPPIYEKVDAMPQFIGGRSGWQSFVVKEMDITPVIEAMDSTSYANYGTKQTAILEFTVCEDGEVCDIEVINKGGISPEFAEEALRVMKKSPKWKPGLKDSKPVRTRFRQPITAILDQ